ncbi:NADP-dependent oxidoreductase [uncultured Xanthomonas sp.]|uniref:NADP-dependent oxidoreductase n=1 Tax=uncultured Xanthomonas sp. TaxID=152831 RepID=UPI0025E88AFB|nr:NADP-dependent oxidoreductase [uncultured Xanthomonas sp.]
MRSSKETPLTMKAVRQRAFGGPDVLQYEDAPVPVLRPGEVLIRVHAIGLNSPDLYLREGYSRLPPEWRPPVAFPLTLGTDVSGVIAAVAEDVDRFSPGEAVYAMVRFPDGLAGGSQAYAQYVAAPASEVALKPVGIDHVHAAGAPMSLLTAWQFLIAQGHDVANPLQPMPHVPVPLQGRTVVVNGAAGGVGHFALQLARWQGARVIAVASGKHEAFVRGLGAETFIDYTKTAPEDVLHDVDLVVDAVGGAWAGKFLRTLKRGGALFPIFPLGFDGHDAAAALGVTVSTTQVRSSGAQLGELAELLDAGTVRVAIDSTFALWQARQAHERAERGHVQGKIVMTVE